MNAVRRRAVAFGRGRDLAIGYAVVVVLAAVWLSLVPTRVADGVILSSSTNLVNLRLHPPFVLLVSALVEPSIRQLWIVVPLVWALGALQRWLGRAAVIITVVLGHVGATLFVATVLTAGIVHGRIALSEATATDVGVSYGLVAVLGLLSAGFGRAATRRRFVAALTAGLLLALVAGRSFTDLGHLVAWSVGLALALLVHRARTAMPTGAGATRSMVALEDHPNDLDVEDGEAPQLDRQ